MAPTSGILYVTMQPKPGLPLTQFHDWYNNEHGPNRLRLPFCTNGFRYKAKDGQQPEFMAIYDFPDMQDLNSETYTSMRTPKFKSPREVETMKQIEVNRKIYDQLSEKRGSDFKVLEDISNEGEQNIMRAVLCKVKPGQEEEFNRFYEEDHIPLLMKVPGWRRSRRFRTSQIVADTKEEPLEFLAIHEYAPENGVETSEEWKAAMSSDWMKKIMSAGMFESFKSRPYDLFYTFGPAPRHVGPEVTEWTHPDGKTNVRSTSLSPDSGAVESYITTPDGVELPFRLEGSTDPSAPLVVCVNSVMVEYGIWDAFLKHFFSNPSNRKYRVLRYHARGRTGANAGSKPCTVDLLASDIITMLDALRVKKAACIIGVSLGGATVLNTALKYSNRIGSFISCDTNANAPAGNSKAWGERIAVAEKEGSKSASGETLVGEELAEMTVRRWFTKESYESDDQALLDRIARTKEMVRTNSLEGFRTLVQALFEYDLREEMKTAAVKGAFVVGSGDGVLPKTMQEMASGYGKGAELKVVEGAGHLPMVEKPVEFDDFVTGFLGSS